MTVAYSRSRYGESSRIAWLDDPRGGSPSFPGSDGVRGTLKMSPRVLLNSGKFENRPLGPTILLLLLFQ